MSNTTVHNSEANLEARQLTDDELDAVSGGAFPIVVAQMAIGLGEIKGETNDAGHSDRWTSLYL